MLSLFPLLYSHHDSASEHSVAYQRLVATGEVAPGYAADDGAGLHFVGTALARIVSSRPKARAYCLERVDGQARETEIAPEYLNGV